MIGKLRGKALDKSYQTYIERYKQYAKGGRMNSGMMSKGEYATAHYEARLTGDTNLMKNIPRNLASAQRVVTQNQAKYYSELLEGYSVKDVKKTNWLTRYHEMYPEQDLYITTAKGNRYRMTEAQALYFILQEAGYSDEEIYNE